MRYDFTRQGYFAAVLIAFANSASADAQRNAIDNRRFPVDSFWSTRWMRGGSEEPERFVEPRQLVRTGAQLAVLDLGMREITLLNASTGAPLRTMRSSGEGPGEFKRPSMLIALGTHFGVIDQATSRLSMFSAGGTLAWDTPLTDAVMLEGVCMHADASVFVKTLGADRSLRLIDSTGRVRWQRSLPMHRPGDELPPFASMGFVSGPITGTRCAIVPQFGGAWYTVDALGNVRSFAYVEPGTDPVLKTSTTVLDKSSREELRRVVTTSATPAIARGAVVRGDTLIVMGGATRRSPFRLLDYYVLPSGRYVYSRKLFASPTALTIADDGTFYAAFIDSENASVMAFVPTKVAPPPPPKAKRTDSTTSARSGVKPPPR